jgi:hypothetical protein
MNKNKFSVVISHIQNDLYAVVLNAWYINEEGIRNNIDSLTKSGVSLDEAHKLTMLFIEKNQEVKVG